MSIFANRTPTIGLNYGSEASVNWNWSALDALIASAFQPGSPIQLPPLPPPPPPGPLSIANGQLAVGATVTQAPEDISVPTTVLPLSSEVEVARVDYSSPRQGPILLTGLISLSIYNSGASAADCTFQMNTRMPGGLRIVHFFSTVAAGVKLPLAIPVGAFLPSQNTATPFVSVSFIKLTGADATMRLQTEDGRLTAIELA